MLEKTLLKIFNPKDIYRKVHCLSYKKLSKLILISCLFALSSSTRSQADDNYDRGMAFFNKGDYKNAAMYFSQSLRSTPSSSALYYASLCCQKLGNNSAAHNGFSTIIQCFPNSIEADYARKAMGSSQAPAINARTTTQTYSRSSNTPATTSTVSSSKSADDKYVTISHPSVNTANAQAGVKAGLSRIPQSLKDAVFGDGCKIVITPTVLEYRPSLASSKPRGYSHGGGYDNTPAMFEPSDNEIIIAEKWGWKNGPAVAGPVLEYEDSLGHEFGHAFDTFLGKAIQGKRRSFWDVSETHWFINTYTKETNNLTNSQRREVAYFVQEGEAGASELFAELFGSIYSSRPTSRQRNLAQYFPETRAKIYKLASLSRFDADTINAAFPDILQKQSENQ